MQPNSIVNRSKRRSSGELEEDLDCLVVFVGGEAERAERTAHAVQAVHVAFALVRVGVDFALDEEARLQQWPEPWRAHVVFVRPSTSLHTNQTTLIHKSTTNIYTIDQFQLAHHDPTILGLELHEAWLPTDHKLELELVRELGRRGGVDEKEDGKGGWLL